MTTIIFASLKDTLISRMNIASVGTGANGAAIAADLIRGGLDVTLIDQWPENVAAIRVTLTSDDLARINQELPHGITAGERYNEAGMTRLNK